MMLLGFDRAVDESVFCSGYRAIDRPALDADVFVAQRYLFVDRIFDHVGTDTDATVNEVALAHTQLFLNDRDHVFTAAIPSCRSGRTGMAGGTAIRTQGLLPVPAFRAPLSARCSRSMLPSSSRMSMTLS